MLDEQLPPKPATLQAIDEIIDEIGAETDRGAAIFAASLLDEKLKRILSNFLLAGPAAKNLLSQSNAPLGTFSSRMNLAAALALITEEEYKDCDIIRRIRNDFAHKFELSFSFENERVSTLCRNLLSFRLPEETDETYKKYSARRLFLIAVVYIQWSWRKREEHVLNMRIKPIDWNPITWSYGEDEKHVGLHIEEWSKKHKKN